MGSSFLGDIDLLLGADVIPPRGVLLVHLGVVASPPVRDPTSPSTCAGREALAPPLLGDADTPLPAGVFLTGVIPLPGPLGAGIRLGVLGAPASGDNLRRLLGDCDIANLRFNRAFHAPAAYNIRICVVRRLCVCVFSRIVRGVL